MASAVVRSSPNGSTTRIATASASPPRDVPAYLPAIAWPLLAWCRAHVARVARRYHVGTADLWDETVTALLRAALYFVPERPADYVGPYPTALAPEKSFRHYAKIAVHRACWRYVARRAEKLPLHLSITVVPKDYDRTYMGHEHQHGLMPPEYEYRRRNGTTDGTTDLGLEHAWASAEEEVLAREAVYLHARNSGIEPLTGAMVLVHSHERPERNQDAGTTKPRVRAGRASR